MARDHSRHGEDRQLNLAGQPPSLGGRLRAARLTKRVRAPEGLELGQTVQVTIWPRDDRYFFAAA